MLNYKYPRLATSTSVSNCYLVYIAQVNSTFRARLLASSEVNIAKYYSPPEQPMASLFASVSEEEILSMNEEVVPKNTKMATKFGVIVFNGKLFNLSNLCFTALVSSTSLICRQEGETELVFSKKSLTAIWSALDRHLTSPRLNKPFSIIGNPLLQKQKKNPQQLFKNSQLKIEAT